MLIIDILFTSCKLHVSIILYLNHVFKILYNLYIDLYLRPTNTASGYFTVHKLIHQVFWSHLPAFIELAIVKLPKCQKT